MKTLKMKYLSLISSALVFFVLTSCSSNEEPTYPVFARPSSITTTAGDGADQTFEYDEYGRIIAWSMHENDSASPTSYTARYSYPDGNTIRVESEEVFNNQKRCFEETILLVNGRASKSEGTFVAVIDEVFELRKTYRLEFDYDLSNHLNVVRHSEVFGIGDGIKSGAWDSAMTWENYLIWEDGNLKEYQDFQGNSSPYRITKYEYSILAVAHPVIIPLVINSAHHMPLFMQGVFGPNSVNLVESSAIVDHNGEVCLSRQYAYEFDQACITGFVETISGNTAVARETSYKVRWTEKFM